MTSFLFFTLFPTLFWTSLRAFGTASGLMELPSASGPREALMEPLGTIWNARSAIVYCSLAGDTISVLIRPWTARRANGTGFSLLEPPLAPPSTLPMRSLAETSEAAKQRSSEA